METNKSFFAIFSSKGNTRDLISKLPGNSSNVKVSDFQEGISIIEVPPNLKSEIFKLSDNRSNDGSFVLICSTMEKTLRKVYDLFWNLIPQRIIDKNTVDMSNIIDRIQKESFSSLFNVLSIVFFLSSVYCSKKSIIIEKIILSNNSIISSNLQMPIKKYFPNLRTIIASNCPSLKDGFAALKEQLNSNGIELLLEGDVQDKYADSWLKKHKVSIIDNPGYEISPDQVTLDMIKPITIEIDEFPTNSFILQFFEETWNSVEDIKPFYEKNAVFSISIIQCGSINPLNLLLPYSRNLLNGDTNLAEGPDDIIELQKQIFPYGFMAHPTSMNNVVLGEGLFGVVLHGVFQYMDNSVQSFDRSFIIGYDGTNMLITNDQICCHEL